MPFLTEQEREEIDRLLQSSNPDLIPQKPFGRQKLFLQDLAYVKEAFYGGAAGGMKSSALLMAALEYVHVPHYAALILRRTYTDLALPDAIMARAKEWLIGKPGVHWSEGDKTFTFDCPGGGTSTLTFGYLESDKDKYRYQSSAYQFIAFDEVTQFEQDQYRYLFSRLRRPAIPCGGCMQAMEQDVTGAWVHQKVNPDCTNTEPNEISFREYADLYNVPLRMRSASNPGGVGHFWVKERFIPEDYTKEQAAEERIWTKINVDEEDESEYQTYFVPSRVQDNPFLDQKSYIEGLGLLGRVEKAQLREGDWAIAPDGTGYFNYDAIELFSVVKPAIGELIEVDNEVGEKVLLFVQKPDGMLAVWKKPKPGRTYVQGNDTATGKDANQGKGKIDRDWSVSQILDLESGEQCARYRGRVSERWFGEQWERLHRWYNGAYVVPAVTGGYGRAALNRALDCGLPPSHIYTQEDETGTQGRKVSPPDFGFTETTVTRPSLYSTLDLAFHQHAIEVYDAVTINEAHAFQLNKDGKPEARSGAKDDTITALALAVKGIRVAPKYIRNPLVGKAPLPVKYGKPGQTEEERMKQVNEIRRRNSEANARLAAKMAEKGRNHG